MERCHLEVHYPLPSSTHLYHFDRKTLIFCRPFIAKGCMYLRTGRMEIPKWQIFLKSLSFYNYMYTLYLRPENGTHFELILPIKAITGRLPTYTRKELLTSSYGAGLKDRAKPASSVIEHKPVALCQLLLQNLFPRLCWSGLSSQKLASDFQFFIVLHYLQK